MSTPLAHSLIGLCAGRIVRPPGDQRPALWYGVAVVAANAADFDILLGLLLGDVNGYHRAASHSLLAAVATAAVITVVLGPVWQSRRRLAAMATISYASHIVLDMCCGQGGRVFGEPVFWPFSNRFVASPWPLLRGIRHGGAGDTSAHFWSELLTWHNVGALGLELAVFLPLLVCVWVLTANRRKKDAHEP